VTAPAATERALQLARAGYGAALVLAPGPAILLATGRLPGRRACRVARLLGARHLAQATLTALTPLPAVFGAGAEVDALHAASMLMLAAVDRAARRAALTDTVAEAAFAAAGLAAAASRRGGTGRQSCRCSAHPRRRSRGDGAART
jgi:hypothetical protein